MSIYDSTSTADIILFSGLPGSGKTLRLVEYIVAAIAAGASVYVCNVKGLNVPGVIPWEDPRKWQELPPGSVLVVDEAQGFFPMRRAGDPPGYITALNTIRHLGVRMLLVSQDPVYLDTHVRGLIGRHEHLLREDGKQSSRMFVSNEVMADVKSKRLRKSDSVDRSVYKFDPALFPLYKSAEIHTRAYVMPLRVKKGIAFFAVCGLCVAGVGYAVYRKTHPDPVPAAAAATSSPTLAAGIVGSKAPLTPEQYQLQFIPRMAGKPWSAPIYDGAKPTTVPDLLCAISGAGDDSTCHCYTEQVTPYVGLTDQQCRLFAKGGVYNPFRPQSGQQGGYGAPGSLASVGQSVGVQGSPVAATAVQAPSGGAYGRMTTYGQIHTNAAPAGDPDYHADHF